MAEPLYTKTGKEGKSRRAPQGWKTEECPQPDATQ